MNERVLFVAPAKMYPVNADGKPLQHIRENVSLPALTVLGSLKSAGFETEFMDLCAEGFYNQTPVNKNTYRFGLPDEAVVERISETKPIALLVTSMFSTEQQMVDDLAAKVKASYPHLPIIVGGIHATLKPDWTLEAGNIDYIVLGEGEETVPELLKVLQLGTQDLPKGVAYKKNGRVEESGRRPLITNLNRPWALEEVLLNNGGYRYNDDYSRRSQIYTHLTDVKWVRNFSLYYSRGCPIHCDYCASSERDGLRVRHIGSKRMFNDLKFLHEVYGVKIFYNQADTFGFHEYDIKFLKELSIYRKDNPNFVLNNPNAFFVRIFFPSRDGYELDEELLDLYAGAGLNVMTLAVETFNQRFNKKINFDKIQPEKIDELLTAIHRRGIKTELYMMYAFPGQTKEELIDDEKTIESFSHLDEVAWQSCMIFPGTEYWREGLREGWFTEESYKRTLKEGYFFHQLPERFNFSQIPTSELRAFRNRHAPNF